MSGNPNGFDEHGEFQTHEKDPCPICGEQVYQLPYHIQDEHS